jgi:hypothetical protein
MKTVPITLLILLMTSAGAALAQDKPNPLDLEYKQRAPALQTVPPRKIEEDTSQALSEIDRQRNDRAMRESQPGPLRRPDLDRDVTQGIQQRNLGDVLRR